MNFDPFDGTPQCIADLNLKRDPLPFNDFPFIVGINKPVGITSFDCIRRMRPRLFDHLGRGKGRRKLKIGHFGTLDPFADGVLLVGTGKAMRLMNLVQSNLKKKYTALCEFGPKTITGDLDGEVIEKWEGPFDSDLESRILESLIRHGQELQREYLQVPPYFSAVKHEGKPLYEYARSGIFIDKEAVAREIYELSVERSSQSFHFKMNCSVSSGTYIRGLWQDLLADYGKLGHLKTLCRTAYGNVLNTDCTDLECFTNEKEKPFKYLLPWEILDFPIVELSKAEAGAFLQGGFLCLDLEINNQFFWAVFEGVFLGLGEKFEDNELIKVKALVNFY